jgi:DNA-directed RNA polymerase subunit RPC12/RpoP
MGLIPKESFYDLEKEVNTMENKYICLACGNHFAVDATMSSAEKKCSRCKSTRVLKMDLSTIFNFSGGGG